MKVIRENVDALNANLKVQISPEDYQSKVKSILEKHRKTSKTPGFRPGQVPMGLIQKQYGKSVLLDELNRIVNSALYSYISDNKIDILGNPIPKEGKEVEGSFDKPDSFVFDYQIGLSPLIDVKLSAKSKYDYVKVKVDEKLIDKQLEDLRRRYGKLSSGEVVTEKDLVLGQFVELDEAGEIKQGGILHSSTISMEFVEDNTTSKSILGAKIGDKIKVNPANVSRGGSDTAAMLGIKEEQLAEISDSFQMTITEIKKMQLAEMNQELFDKLFGENVVSSEKEVRSRISADLGNMFIGDSDRLLTKVIYDDLIENTKVDLPSIFLKRWIKLSNEKPLTDEQIDQDFEAYSKSLKWQLIQKNIFTSNDIRLDQNEAIDYTKGLLVNNYAQYGIPAPEDKELTQSALDVLKNKEEANRIYDMLAEAKLTSYFKSTVKLKEKEVSYDDFVALASK
jgi:trigger factor